jgi:hypothetical protein
LLRLVFRLVFIFRLLAFRQLVFIFRLLVFFVVWVIDVIDRDRVFVIVIVVIHSCDGVVKCFVWVTDIIVGIVVIIRVVVWIVVTVVVIVFIFNGLSIAVSKCDSIGCVSASCQSGNACYDVGRLGR